MQNAPLVSLCSPVVARLHHLVSLTLVTIFPSPVAAATERTGAPCALVWGGPYSPVGPTPTCHHPLLPPRGAYLLHVGQFVTLYPLELVTLYQFGMFRQTSCSQAPSFPLTFHPWHPQSVLLSPPILTAVCLWGGQLSPGSFSSSWDLPNGGRGWLQSGIARQLALVRGVVARICTPRTLSGGLCPDQKELLFFVCCDWGIAGVVSAFTVHCCL